MKGKLVLLILTIVGGLASGGLLISSAQAPVGTAFTYQGQLKNGGALVNGNCDFAFGLWDSLNVQKGITQTQSNIAVTNGLFNVQLNAGGQFGVLAFDGNARYLASAVRCPAGVGVTTTLSPREQLTAAPYAQYAVNAASAVTANSVLTPTLRKYYLTATTYQGNAALTACAVGYHMASLWEIFNPSGLLYATNLGAGVVYTTADSGQGPPASVPGWIRTGWTSAGSSNNAGLTNCDAWTSNSSSITGTRGYLELNWAQEVEGSPIYYLPVSPFNADIRSCNTPQSVWCVIDLTP